MKLKYKCPCCGFYTYNIPAKDDCGYICPVCFWENDSFISSPNEPSDQNHGMTLNEARKNYTEYGVYNNKSIVFSRKPSPDELQGAD